MPHATLIIRKPTPSLNVVLKVHPTRRKALWRPYAYLLADAIGRVGRRNLPIGLAVPVALTIHRYGWNLLDHDNLVGGSKGLVDLLVRYGLLVDDSPKWLSPTPVYEQTRKRSHKRTEITLEWGEL